MSASSGKTILTACALLLLVSLPSVPRDDQGLIARAREFVERMRKGDFQGAVEHFDETMMRLAPPEKMQQAWEMVISQVGAFKQEVGVRTQSIPEYDIVFITCAFEKATLDIKVVFDKEGRIAGQFFLPAAPREEPAPPDYADKEAFTETEVEVGREPWLLPGTLSMPCGRGPFPAVVLVHGSGPNDRDETVGRNKPFRDLAWGLASRGIAVLRYDKRTKVHGRSMAGDAGLRITVFEEAVEDVLHAVSLLKETERIDPEKIFILGHSLGGTLIPRIAAREPGAAGFIIMAGAARPLEDLYLEQLEYIFRLDGTFTPEEKEMLEEAGSVVRKIKCLTKKDIASPENLLGAGPAYWLDLRGYHPAQEARKISRPLLILQGGRDYQVAGKDFEAWKKALSSRRNVSFKLYPELNHLFIAGEGPSSPAEYLRAGEVAESVIRDIASWIREHSSTFP